MQIMFYSFYKLSRQLFPTSYTPYLFSSQIKKMEKTATNNDQNDQISSLFAILRQILKKNYLQDVYSCKMYITVYRYIYI